jgi:hypothetical protein
MAQSVVYGPKQRTIKVPAGWAFVKSGSKVFTKDKKFNRTSHAWDPVDLDNLSPGDIIIRDMRNTNTAYLDMDRHAVRVIE